jgi:predicted dehydrogenase
MAEGAKVRWGIVSTANINRKVVPGIQKSEHSEVVAIASRDPEKARAGAAEYGIPRAYGSYEELFADPNIDAVYNPLPNHLHVDITLAATRAGKHVLCEKPIGMNAADAARLREVPGDRIVLEAFMVRFHPQWHRAREIVQSGRLGTVRAVRAVFSYFNDDPGNVRNMADIGGGGVMDIGCYPVVGTRFLLGAEPRRVVSLIDRDPNFETDRLASVIADFGEGRHLNFVCSTQAVGHQKIEVIGTKARVEIQIPFNAPADMATAIVIDSGITMDGSLTEREVIPPCDQYSEEAEAFALAVLGRKSLPYGIEDSIQQMRILDAIFESERRGAWVEL